MNGMSTVVVGVDESPVSLCALWLAVDEARRRYWPLQIIYVSTDVAFPTAGAAAAMAGGAFLTAVDRDRGRHIVSDALIELFGGRPEDVPIRVTIAAPPIGRALVDATTSADLLIVGRTRRGLIHRLILGSVSSYCVARAPCPVLTVPEPETPRRSYTIRPSRRILRRAVSDH
jgi:nucleotide-binding universal stress UspA family protein